MPKIETDGRVLRISAARLFSIDMTAECCDCGKEAELDAGRIWTIQWSNYRCTACSDDEGILE